LTETLGQVALEAQASGVPTVVPRGTALAEQVVDGVTGIHAQSASAEDIAAALLPLVADADRRATMGEAARASMLARPTWDDIFQRLVVDYADLHRDDPVERLMLRRPIEAGVL
jgi:glycosyltransferase involved in cell wall biosynthesis